MLAYGDLTRTVSWDEAVADADDIIERGKVAQAIIDHEFRINGEDRWTPLHQAALRFEFPYVPELTIREPEGFAFYAVYPEQYALAARRLPPSRKRLVIGVRTIGTTLGAVVARACNAAGFVTPRPVGHPFDRKLAMDASMREHILSFEDFAIVDEGPGLSGSTFGCVADFLEDHGVPRERIAFLPSHDGMPGNQCSERHWVRWQSAQKFVTPFDAILPSILEEAATMIGPIDETVDIGGGLWRDHVEHRERPPSSMSREPRKYLVRASGKRYLLKFSGLGRIVDVDRDREPLRRAVERHLARLFETDNRMHRWEWIITRDGEVLKCDALDHAHWHDAIGPQDATWAQIDRCTQILSEPLPDEERALWERERKRYVGRQTEDSWQPSS